MEFAFVDALSLPGNPVKPNDDAWAQTARAAVVLDGATSLGDPLLPGDSDAAWIARFGARRLMAHVQNGDEAREALRSALADAENSFAGLRRRGPKENWENPYASMMFIVEDAAGFGALWFGDCGAIVKRSDTGIEVVGEAFAKRAAEARRVKMLAEAKGLAPASGANLPEFLGALRAARNLVNSERGGWLFGPDATAADRARSAHIAASPGTTILLASDGFLALVSDYERYDAASLMEAAERKGLEALGEELRAIEDGDPEGRRYPRFKKSDDATALLLKLA
jgi:hypothetical protein